MVSLSLEVRCDGCDTVGIIGTVRLRRKIHEV